MTKKKRTLHQRVTAPYQLTDFSKEVPLLTNRRPLPPSEERRAIRWFGILRKILLDPSLADSDDLFSSATPTDHRNLTGPPPKPRPPHLSRKASRRSTYSDPLEPLDTCGSLSQPSGPVRYGDPSPSGD